MRRAIILFFALLCISGLAESVATRSSPLKAVNCVSGNESSNQENEAADRATPSFFKPFSSAINTSCRTAYWFGDAIHEQHDAIEALGVVVTAFFTATLWMSTRSLQRAAVKQGSDTERLFVQDQRPWINIQLEVRDEIPVFNDDGSMTLRLRLNIKNIGKSPAFNVGNGSQTHIGYNGAEEAFHALRRFCEAQSLSKGLTMFPGDEGSYDTFENITSKQIQQSRAIPDERPSGAMQFIVVGYRYNSGFSDAPLETIRMYSFGVGGDEGALPAKAEDAQGGRIMMRLWKELVV